MRTVEEIAEEARDRYATWKVPFVADLIVHVLIGRDSEWQAVAAALSAQVAALAQERNELGMELEDRMARADETRRSLSSELREVKAEKEAAEQVAPEKVDKEMRRQAKVINPPTRKVSDDGEATIRTGERQRH